MKTEDLSLLKEEYDSLIKLSQSKSFLEKMLAYIGYKLRKDPLMEKRDKFIAERINETLGDGEVGVLFIGVYHNVLPRISQDITVYELKERSKVKAYFDELVWTSITLIQILLGQEKNKKEVFSVILRELIKKRENSFLELDPTSLFAALNDAPFSVEKARGIVRELVNKKRVSKTEGGYHVPQRKKKKKKEGLRLILV